MVIGVSKRNSTIAKFSGINFPEGMSLRNSFFSSAESLFISSCVILFQLPWYLHLDLSSALHSLMVCESVFVKMYVRIHSSSCSLFFTLFSPRVSATSCVMSASISVECIVLCFLFCVNLYYVLIVVDT